MEKWACSSGAGPLFQRSTIPKVHCADTCYNARVRFGFKVRVSIRVRFRVRVKLRVGLRIRVSGNNVLSK